MQAQKNHFRTKVEGYEMIHRATRMTKSLYNLALYTIWEHYQETKHVLTLKELFHKLKDHPLLFEPVLGSRPINPPKDHSGIPELLCVA